MKVLIAVDGSAGSFEAVEQLARVLAPDKDEIAMYCSPPEVRTRGYGTEPQVLAQAQQALADTIVNEALQRLPSSLAARAPRIIGIQDPRHGIVTEADAWDADVIAVGARGLGTFERLMLGSVSRAVVHRSSRPVWVARKKASETRGALNVLLACDSPLRCQPSANLLVRFTWPAATCFATLSVIPSLFGGRIPQWMQQQTRSAEVEAMVQAWAKEQEDDLRASRTRVEEFIAALPPPLKTCRSLISEGDPVNEILVTIQRENIDLVVVGSQHKHTLATAILGSTSEAVLAHAPCSVLVVPTRGA